MSRAAGGDEDQVQGGHQEVKELVGTCWHSEDDSGGRVEKYALQGGGATHRQDLSQMVALKDNHIMKEAASPRLLRGPSAGGFSTKIEAETGNLADALRGCCSGADIVMLDNFSRRAHKVAEVSQVPPRGCEASGGITEDTMGDFMGPCVDVISRGNLTQGCPAWTTPQDRPK